VCSTQKGPTSDRLEPPEGFRNVVTLLMQFDLSAECSMLSGAITAQLRFESKMG